MPHASAQSAARPFSPRNPLGRYTPRRLSAKARWRFGRERRAEYLGRILGGEPSSWQAATIASMVEIEWLALTAEAAAAEGDSAAWHDARENRRLFQRLLADFEKSCAAPPLPRPKTLDEARAFVAAQKAIDRR